jgi:hypothetical protein
MSEQKVIPIRTAGPSTIGELERAIELLEQEKIGDLLLIYTLVGTPNIVYHFKSSSPVQVLGLLSRISYEVNKSCQGVSP